ncbi:hypothetical protein TherJR_2005 [Thermincola potens JR]|uniref:Uncharacterized protein n=1 Tax=Thermincola potens (strain JR) TaxID=635013 RepID=D5X8H4_THEPJ|nr:hypothetical protein TherJR_2005 [Thermincola potens JR]
MSIEVRIPVIVLNYTPEQYQSWVDGNRDDCPDKYCRGLPGSMGFGEYIVGKYFSSPGYLWIHHDFNIFGGNRPGKYC